MIYLGLIIKFGGIGWLTLGEETVPVSFQFDFLIKSDTTLPPNMHEVICEEGNVKPVLTCRNCNFDCGILTVLSEKRRYFMV